jgi:Ca2+-transporting ATPase
MGTHWHAHNPQEVLELLNTDGTLGLSADEALKRRAAHGANELVSKPPISPFTIFIDQFKNILVLILILAVILSAAVGEWVDALIILIIVVFCAVLGFVQEYRAEKAIEALKRMLAPTVTLLRDGEVVRIESRDVVPGDIVQLEAGDRIPADARVIEAHLLKCDEASLTGESLPVAKQTRSLEPSVAVSDRRNMVFTGTTVTYGRGKAVVTATAMETEFGKIAREVAAIDGGKTPLEKRTDEIGKWLGIICFTICGLVAGISFIREMLSGTVDLGFIVTMIMFAVALAVAAVPEALAAIVTGALALGMQAMARKNALVRKMPAVETLGCTTVICSDKTGTLTRGEMTVRRMFIEDEWVEVTGAGYRPEGEFKTRPGNGPISAGGFNRILEAGLLCNDAHLDCRDDQWTVRGDPTEGSLLVAAAKAGIDIHRRRQAVARVEEIPFSSERKCMTTLHRKGAAAVVAYTKGAPEVVLNMCNCTLKDGAVVELTAAERKEILNRNEAMASDALRVLGFACREIDDGTALHLDQIETDMIFLGLMGMMDPPRPEAGEAVKTCREVHIKPVMITGDHQLTAVAVAAELDIYRDGDAVLTGDDLADMSETQLQGIVDRVTVYARVSPMDKLKIVKAWQNRGDVVAMTGDGVNDAPALKHADIGVAMGISGTEVAKEASDMILSDDNFATIVSAIERGRWIYDNIKKYLAYLLQCNITEVIVIGGIVLLMGPEYLPLLPAAILYINLATDGLPALALGVAPPDKDIMQRPPRNPKASVFGWDVTSFILRAVIVECPFFFLVFYFTRHDIVHARTAVFFLFIIVEFVVALNCRSLIFSIFQAPPHKWLLLALGWELILVAVLVNIPAVRAAFGITLPTLSDVGIMVAFGLLVLLIIEGTKVALRSKQR